MNKEDIIRMAKQAGFERLGHDEHDYVCYPDDIVAFAALVASAAVRETSAEYRLGWNDGQIAEREACADVIKENWRYTANAKEMVYYILERGQA